MAVRRTDTYSWTRGVAARASVRGESGDGVAHAAADDSLTWRWRSISRKWCIRHIESIRPTTF